MIFLIMDPEHPKKSYYSKCCVYLLIFVSVFERQLLRLSFFCEIFRGLFSPIITTIFVGVSRQKMVNKKSLRGSRWGPGPPSWGRGWPDSPPSIGPFPWLSTPGKLSVSDPNPVPSSCHRDSVVRGPGEVFYFPATEAPWSVLWFWKCFCTRLRIGTIISPIPAKLSSVVLMLV